MCYVLLESLRTDLPVRGRKRTNLTAWRVYFHLNKGFQEGDVFEYLRLIVFLGVLRVEMYLFKV